MVTDAGFRVPWFTEVLLLGWDYVGRIRNRDMVVLEEETDWIHGKTLYLEATSKPVTFQRESWSCP